LADLDNGYPHMYGDLRRSSPERENVVHVIADSITS
jgi:hypothetical protein